MQPNDSLKQLRIIPEKWMVASERSLLVPSQAKSQEKKSKTPFFGFYEKSELVEDISGETDAARDSYYTTENPLMPRSNYSNCQALDDSLGRVTKVVVGYSREELFDEAEQNPRVHAFNYIYEDLMLKLTEESFRHYSERKEGAFTWLSLAKKHTIPSLTSMNNAIVEMAKRKGKPSSFALNFQVERYDNGLLWVQDDFVPVMEKRKGKETRLKLLGRPRGEFENKAIAKAFRCDYEQVLDNRLAGGNILFLGNYMLVGYNALEREDGTLWEEEEYEAHLTSWFGNERKIVWIGGREEEWYIEYQEQEAESYSWWKNGANYQPIFHLDFFITPAGRTEDGNDRVVLGIPECSVNNLKIPSLQIELVRKQLESISSQLEAEGLIVIRSSLPLTWIDVPKTPNDSKRIWILTPYNNALVQYIEHQHESNYVLVPRFSGQYNREEVGYKTWKESNTKGGDWSDLIPYERKVEDVWKSLGFRVVFVANFLPLVLFKGTMRCILKVVERKTK